MSRWLFLSLACSTNPVVLKCISGTLPMVKARGLPSGGSNLKHSLLRLPELFKV
jgi:hypothetical protein